MLESMEHHDGINVSVFVGASVNAADFPGLIHAFRGSTDVPP